MNVPIQTQIDTLKGILESFELERDVLVAHSEKAIMRTKIVNLTETIGLLKAISDIREPY